jgi:hypothetical protein
MMKIPQDVKVAVGTVAIGVVAELAAQRAAETEWAKANPEAWYAEAIVAAVLGGVAYATGQGAIAGPMLAISAVLGVQGYTRSNAAAPPAIADAPKPAALPPASAPKADTPNKTGGDLFGAPPGVFKNSPEIGNGTPTGTPTGGPGDGFANAASSAASGVGLDFTSVVQQLFPGLSAAENAGAVRRLRENAGAVRRLEDAGAVRARQMNFGRKRAA